jgi:Fe-S-cluster containining protein
MDKLDYRFQCIGCGYCCRHEPGFVFLTKEDLLSMAIFLTMKPEQFKLQHCRRISMSYGDVISLNEKKNHDCIFWDQGCSVYSVRPVQCRSYPFWPGIIQSDYTWNQEKQYCPGIDKGPILDKKEIEESLDAKNSPLISWTDELL